MIKEIFVPYGEGRYLRVSGHYCHVNANSIVYKIGVLSRNISEVKEVLEEIPGAKIEVDRRVPFSYIYFTIPNDRFPLFYGKCDNCGEIRPVFPYILHIGLIYLFCSKCAPTCFNCGKIIPHYYQRCELNLNNYIHRFAYELYCDDCVPHCKRCNRILDDYNPWYNINGSYYCNECAGICGHCGEAYLINELCPECRCCSNCCECGQEDEREYEVMNYSYKPIPIFHRLNENPLYLGVELEVEANTSHNQSDIIKTVRDELGLTSNICYFKRDSSLSDKGVEIVFHPATLRYFTKAIKITNVLEELKKIAVSYNTRRCGIHVHIPKSTLTLTEKRKLICFTFKCRKYLIKFSKRNSRQIERWCKFYDSDAYKLDENSWKDSRYRVVNFCPPNTIEFRLFRGTLYSPRFLAFLRFVVAVVDYVKNIGISYIALNDGDQVWYSFVKFVKNKYHHLYQFLKKEGLVIQAKT